MTRTTEMPIQEMPDAPPTFGRGWYPDPEDPSRSRYWNGNGWSERTKASPTAPPQPDIEGLQPTRLTFVAIFLALVGFVMTLPFLGVMFNTEYSSMGVLYLDHTGWRNTTWVVAFFVGLSSFLLSLVSRSRERLRRSRSGKRWVRVALTLALVGACAWALPLIAEAGSGL